MPHHMVDIIRITNSTVVRRATVIAGQCLWHIAFAQVQALFQVGDAALDIGDGVITLLWINPRINGGGWL